MDTTEIRRRVAVETDMAVDIRALSFITLFPSHSVTRKAKFFSPSSFHGSCSHLLCVLFLPLVSVVPFIISHTHTLPDSGLVHAMM
jgi:hypothetical protein